jgi:hypothetical protein
MSQPAPVSTAVRGLFLLILLLGGPAGPIGLAHLAQQDDLACDPVLGGGEPGSETLTSPVGRGVQEPRHCATCHWLQNLRWQATAGSPALLGTDRIANLNAPSNRNPLPAAVGRVAARAPPQFLRASLSS